MSLTTHDDRKAPPPKPIDDEIEEDEIASAFRDAAAFGSGGGRRVGPSPRLDQLDGDEAA